MQIRIGKKTYEILFFKRIIPSAFYEVIKKFNNEPEKEFFAKSDKLEVKVVLITGSYKGLGLTMAKRFLREGAKVIISGRNKSQLEKVVNIISNTNLNYIEWDITNIKDFDSNFEKAERIFGQINILINNAGVTSNTLNRQSFEVMDDKHVHYVHDINVIGTRAMCLAFANRYEEGSILNIISTTALRPAQDAYFTSKWAIYSFTKVFGKECDEKGKRIMVNGLCPGPIKTDMTHSPINSLLWETLPNRRIGLTNEIAELALHQVLSSFHGQNGVITVCDGGETLN